MIERVLDAYDKHLVALRTAGLMGRSVAHMRFAQITTARNATKEISRMVYQDVAQPGELFTPEQTDA